LKNYCCKTKDYYAHTKISRTIILIIKNQGARTLLLWEENNRCPWTSSRPDNKSTHAQSRAWLSTFAISNLSKARSSKKTTINLYLLFNSLSNLFLFFFIFQSRVLFWVLTETFSHQIKRLWLIVYNKTQCLLVHQSEKRRPHRTPPPSHQLTILLLVQLLVWYLSLWIFNFVFGFRETAGKLKLKFWDFEYFVTLLNKNQNCWFCIKDLIITWKDAENYFKD